MLDWCTLHWQVTLAELGGETRLLARLPSSSRRISRIGTTHIHNTQVCMRTLLLSLYFLMQNFQSISRIGTTHIYTTHKSAWENFFSFYISWCKSIPGTLLNIVSLVGGWMDGDLCPLVDVVDVNIDAEVKFVHPVSPGGSVKILPAV